MSLIKANAVQVGQSPTATQNFTLAVPSSPDGTIKLARGNAGATTQDVISVDALGNVSFAGTTGLGNISNSTAIATGSTTARSLANRFADVVNVKDFGAVGDGVANDTSAIQAAINYAVPINKPIYFPSGTYLYSSITGLNQNNITIIGDGSINTILKFTGIGIALDIGSSIAFSRGINISGFTVEGNSNTTIIIRATAIARSQWNDINVREANPSTGIGFVLRACMLSRFESLICSQDYNAMTNPPKEGFNIESLAPFGNSSNNTFENLYSEGSYPASSNSIEFGVRISGGDQNTFIGGSPESCKTYGLVVGANCRYNTFIGVGFENLNSTADIADGGTSTKFINCYASQSVILQGQSSVISGGFFERIQIDSLATKNRIHDVLINGWSTGSGGFFDNGIATEWKNIYDQDLGIFIYPLKDRVGISLTPSPCTWTNNTGQYVEVIINGGAVTSATMTRNSITWDVMAGSPNSWLVAPTDTITLTYTGSPTKFWYIPQNGFQG